MRATEKSSIAIGEIAVRLFIVPFCIGIVIAASRIIAIINDIYPSNLPDDSEAAKDRDTYRQTAIWLIIISDLCLAFQILVNILRGLYFGEILIHRFIVFAIVNAVICVLFAFGFFAGGVASAANATNVQDDYDNRACDEIRNSYSDDHRAVEICENVEQLIDSEFFCAGSAIAVVMVNIVLTIMMVISAVLKRKEPPTNK